MDAEAYRHEIPRLISEIEVEAATKRKAIGIEALGVIGALDQDPLDSPQKPNNSPRPLFYAAARRTRKAFWAAYRSFEVAFSEASEGLRNGAWNVDFPSDCFPPAPPFTGEPPTSPLPPPMKLDSPSMMDSDMLGTAFVRMRTYWWSPEASSWDSPQSEEAAAIAGHPLLHCKHVIACLVREYRLSCQRVGRFLSTRSSTSAQIEEVLFGNELASVFLSCPPTSVGKAGQEEIWPPWDDLTR